MLPLSRDGSCGTGANTGSSLHRTGSHRSIGSTGGTGRYVIVFVASIFLVVLHLCRHWLEMGVVVPGQTEGISAQDWMSSLYRQHWWNRQVCNQTY